MPTCHDVQQEAFWRFRFGLYCGRRLSVLDIAWLEFWFGAFLCYFIKTAFLAVEEGAKLFRLKCSLEM